MAVAFPKIEETQFRLQDKNQEKPTKRAEITLRIRLEKDPKRGDLYPDGF